MKNKNIIIGIMGFIILILSVFCLLLIFGVIKFDKFNNTDINNKVEENSKTTESTNTSTNIFYDDATIEKLVRNGKWESYGLGFLDKEYMKYTNVVKKISYDDYSATLFLNGDVLFNLYGENHVEGNLNIHNVVDMVEFNIPGMGTEQLLYLLTSDGDVYSYKFGNVDSKNFDVKKVENISNIERMFITYACKKDAGCTWILYAITNNDDCIKINSDGV